MSNLTTQPIGLYPECRDRIQRIQAAKPDLKNIAAVVRYALQDLDERLAKRQKPVSESIKQEPVAKRRCAVCTTEETTALGGVCGNCGADTWLPGRVAPEEPPAAQATPEAKAPPEPADDGKTRLSAAMKGHTANAVDTLAKVPKGTTRNVLTRGRSLEKAGGGKLLKWVKAEEARLEAGAKNTAPKASPGVAS